MKKRYFFAIPLLIFSLAGCRGYKAPKNSFDKVRVAFEGVEKSFDKLESSGSIKSSKGIANAFNAPNKYDDEYRKFDNMGFLFQDQNIVGHSVDDLSYTQPPMVQFQCLKKVFDKIGKDFDFGTKYYDNITGEVYIDFATGFKDESKKAENKCNYNYLLAMEIELTDYDVIFAKLVFDISLTKGSNTYKTKWFISMNLEYDFKDENPNYSLEMLTGNDEKELSYFNRYTYEYDYFSCQSPTIIEWNKFCMDSSKKLVQDNSHNSLTDYINEGGLQYRVDSPKVYKDGNLYKINKMTDELQKTCGDVYFQDFGCYESRFKSEFDSKQGTKNSAIQDVYKDFTNVIGQDLAYDILCKEEKDNSNQQTAVRPAKIRAMASDGQSGAENYVVSDIPLESVFTGYTDGDGANIKIDLWYLDENNGFINKISSLEGFEFSFTCGRSDDENQLYPFINVNKNATVLEAYDAIKEANNTDDVNEHFILKVKDPSLNVEGRIPLIFGGSLNEQYFAPDLPKEYVNLGIPAYEGKHVSYSLRTLESFEDQDLTLEVDNTDSRELTNYFKKLANSDFVDITNSNYGYEKIYKKNLDNSRTLFLLITKPADFGKSTSKISIDAYVSPSPVSSNKSSTFPNELTQMGVPNFASNRAKFIYENNVLFIFDATKEEQATFEGNFSSSRMKPWEFIKNINDEKDRLVLSQKKIFDDEYICYVVEKTDNPDYVPPIDDQNNLEISFLTLAGDFNQWNIDGKDQKYVFAQNGSSFQLPNVSLEAGQNFKMVANRSWDVSNESTEYGGFGYDDVDNIGEFGAAFAKGENGSIQVNENKVITIRATVSNGRLSFKFQ